MPKRSSKRKRPDINELAADIVDQATSIDQAEPVEAEPVDDGKNPAAVALGRLGGLKGGKARWKGVSTKERSELARKAALARWKKKKKKSP